jgi:hypothetical protein
LGEGQYLRQPANNGNFTLPGLFTRVDLDVVD